MSTPAASGAGPVFAEDRGAIRVVWLNRPETRNAIDMPLRIALAEQIEAAMGDRSVRAIVLTGAGGTFCSGGDIKNMRRQDAASTIPRAQAAQRIVRAIWNGPTPTIAAVEGAAFGAGISLAMACDLVVAAEDARFSTAFMGVGLAGDMGVYASLPARVGSQAAKRLMLSPRTLSGTDAAACGIADILAPAGRALDRAIEEAERIATAAPLALAEMKAMFRAGVADPEGVLEREVTAQARLFDTEDFDEGARAFREKRPPRFAGR